MAYNPNNVNGSATSANSSPVVIASDQAPIAMKGYDAQDDMMKIKSLQKKFRDSFVGTSVDGAKWASSVGTGGSITVGSGVVNLVSGTTAASTTSLTSVEWFTIPFRLSFQLTMSQRIANQEFYVEVISVNATTGVADGLHTAGFLFDGTNANQAKYFTANGGQASLISAATSFNPTTGTGVFEFEPFSDECWWHSGTLDANSGRTNSYRRHQQVLDPNASYKIRLRWLNGTTPATTTTSTLQFVACQDYAELTAEITAGRGIAVAGQAIGVSVTGPVDTELPAATALGDSTANPTAPHVGSCIEAFNGTTWDRLKTDGALQGNGANDTAVGILAVGTGPGFSIRANPANLGTAANSASTFNVDGASAVTIAISTTTTGTFIIEGTADNTNWLSLETFDGSLDLWVSGQSVTPTLGKVYQVISQGYRQVRLRTVTTLGATVAHAVTLTNGNQFLGGIDTGAAPHNFGYTLVHRNGEYTTAQTGAALWTPTTGKKFAVTDITISTGGTTAGVVTLWQGATADTTYTTGTDPVIFRGEFAPSATVKPGAVKSFNVPFVATTVDHILRVTTSAAMTVYVQLNGYEI